LVRRLGIQRDCAELRLVFVCDVPNFITQCDVIAVSDREEKPRRPLAAGIGQPFEHRQDRRKAYSARYENGGAFGSSIKMESTRRRLDVNDIALFEAVVKIT
jgi:hypothetical protein